MKSAYLRGVDDVMTRFWTRGGCWSCRVAKLFVIVFGLKVGLRRIVQERMGATTEVFVLANLKFNETLQGENDFSRFFHLLSAKKKDQKYEQMQL